MDFRQTESGDPKAVQSKAALPRPVQIDFRPLEWEYSTYHFDMNDSVAGWSKSQWQKHIRTLVSVPANVIFTNHALLRMRQRQIKE